MPVWRIVLVVLVVSSPIVALARAQAPVELLAVGLEKPDPGSSSPKVERPAADDGTATLVVDPKVEKKLDLTQFRTADGPFEEDRTSTPSRVGLDTLAASGSSQFSAAGLETIAGKLAGKRVCFVDLREESHGLVNGLPVSWRNRLNNANQGRTLDDIVAGEKLQLEQLARSGRALLTRLSDDEARSQRMEVAVESISTEKELVEARGFDYVRIPVTDHQHPRDDDVDRFLELVRQPGDRWFHFHCKAGKGRTTTFLVMYDMLRNAKQLSTEEIALRQELLGGSRLLEVDSDKDEAATSQDRIEFLHRFHEYCRQNPDDFRTTWSQWKARGRP